MSGVGPFSEVEFAELFDVPIRNGIYKKKEFHGRGLPIVNMGELFAEDRIRSLPTRCLDVTNDEMERFGIRAGDLLFGRRSLVFEGSGKCSIVQLDSPSVFESSIIRARLDLDIADPEYYAAYFQSPGGRARVLSIATRTAVSGIRGSDLARLRVPRPPLSVQRQIGRFSRLMDDLIDNNRRRIEVLEEMAQTIYREWFVHFRYPGHKDVSLVDSPLGSIPDSWAVRPFTEVASFVNGFAFKPSHWAETGRPIIKIKELKNGVTADTPRCEEIEINQKYWIQPGDLLFSWSADLGVYRWSGEPGLLNQHLFLVEPLNGLSSLYLQHSLAAAVPRFWDRAQGTTMRHIKRSALTEVITVVPSPEVDSAFADRVRPLDQLALRLTEMNRDLVEIRDLLLPKLVTGEVEVSTMELDALVEAI